MAGLVATAGTKLSIGGTIDEKTTDFVAADFNGESWIAVALTENLGQLGDESSEITFNAIDANRTFKLKGVRNAGNMALVVGKDDDDPGQSAILAAEAQPFNYAFRLEFNDKPVGGTHGTYRYFIAKVMSAREVLDTTNNVVRVNATLGVNSNIVKVPAA